MERDLRDLRGCGRLSKGCKSLFPVFSIFFSWVDMFCETPEKNGKRLECLSPEIGSPHLDEAIVVVEDENVGEDGRL